MPNNQFNPRHWRFDIVITAIVFALLISFLLNKFNALQINIEKENVNTQIQHFRLGLAEAWLSQNIAHKSSNINAFENANPMILIAELPKNYIGEFAQTPQSAKQVWFYDTQNKQLVYVLNNGELLRYQLRKQLHGLKRLPMGGLDLIEVK